MFREINVVFSEGDMKPISTLCGKNVEFLMLKEVMHIVIIVLVITGISGGLLFLGKNCNI
jgi:hypothetical protein